MRLSIEVFLLYAILCLPFSALIGWMAKSYQRAPFAWFLLSVAFTPVAAFVFLLVADVPHGAVVRKEKEGRARSRHPAATSVREIALSELECPKCGAIVNPATGDGLDSPEDEPWRLICNQCGTEIQP